VGIASYYLLSILCPQYIWWWNFEGLRVSLLVALFTLAGVAFQVFSKKYDFGFLLNRQNSWLAVLWLCIVFSYFSGPYVDSFTFSGLGPDKILSLTNTFFLFYFCATLEMNDLRKLRYLTIIFVISTVYLIYWANVNYFTQNWSQFNLGRLMGPSSIEGGSIYSDENGFAMLFVTGLPFIYYLGWDLQRKWQRYLLWATIPLGWHSIFLTGARGGLVGLGIVVLLMMILSNRKFFAVLLLMSFVIFYQWQAGDVMKQRSQSITSYEGDSSAESRIVAWKGGLRMIVAHPLSGVGVGSFVAALPDFIDSKPKVAHNTFIQFAAESGIVAGLAYLVIVGIFFQNARKIRVWCREHEDFRETPQVRNLTDASTVSFAGLIVCSLFLSLNVYEIFFFLLIFSNALVQICQRIPKLKK
jgi:O-antigen ligase